MRLPRIRFTVRTLLVAVAAVGLLIWAGFAGLGWWERMRHYRHLADTYGGMVRLAEDEAAQKEWRMAKWADDPRQARWARELARSRAQADYYAALSRKYRHLASRPWETARPDPPPDAGVPPLPAPPSPPSLE